MNEETTNTEATTTIDLGMYGIVVTVAGKGGTIQSNLKVGTVAKDLEDIAYLGAIDGLESLILACACEGIDVTDCKFKAAIATAVDAIDYKC